ncbi:hypothetical protein [Actinokineospora spheciospongiae]|uniref:hypothetical protein n=1 Tax=Actinokineospora spheciospongiae TaxID=909613 RepID=UPI000D71B608|nr:hypothetical protein [Actinokineospora spheciospongiae]PWW65627.1 hypothetical protein DFQ13_102382 [Actinokineospora spheciospongiae]
MPEPEVHPVPPVDEERIEATAAAPLGRGTGQPHGRQHVVGLYAGFAAGEAAAGGDGTLTAALLHATDALVRAAADRSDAVRAATVVRPPGWQDPLAPKANAGTEVAAVLAGVAAGVDRDLRDDLWVDWISEVVDRVLSRPRQTLRTVLADLHPTIAEQRGTPLPQRLADLSTTWERALLIATELGHDPAAALAAPDDPLTGALVGALVGARHGAPGMPPTPTRDLLERVADTAHTAFDPALAPIPHVPGAPWSQPVLDPEWDWVAFPDFPEAAVLGYTTNQGFQWNAAHLPGPQWIGLPRPETPAEEVIAYHRCGWLPTTDLLLDTTVLVVEAGDPAGLPVRAYSSWRRLPAGTRAWREVHVRVLVRTEQREVLVDDAYTVAPGHPFEFEALPSAEFTSAEVDGANRAALVERLTALGATDPVHAADRAREQAGPWLDGVRANGFSPTHGEFTRMWTVLGWLAADRPGSPPPGARAWWDATGERVWEAPTFGKHSPREHPDAVHAWHRVVGAYLGFAAGEVAAGGDGTLTAGLLHATDALLRELAGNNPELSPSGDGTTRPVGWLDRWVAPVEPGAEAGALVAAVASDLGAVLLGDRWAPDLSPVLERALHRHAPATHLLLAESGGYGHLLDLRDQRHVPVHAHLPGLAPREQALLIAAVLGHDPGAALAAAPDPVVGAVVGALVGARHGAPGLPPVAAADLLECLATEVHAVLARAQPWTPGVPPSWPDPLPDGAVVDPEWDSAVFGAAPGAAVLGWRRGDDVKRNPGYLPGPSWHGAPPPDTLGDAVLAHLDCGWLPDPDAFTDFPVLVTSEYLFEELGGARTWQAAYTSPRHFPLADRAWREVTMRDLLATTGADGVKLNPAHGGRWFEATGGGGRAESVEHLPFHDRPEQIAEITRACRDLDAPDDAPEAIRAHLRAFTVAARALGHDVTGVEYWQLAAVLPWTHSARTTPPPVGTRTTWSADGEPVPEAPTFGKVTRVDAGAHPHAWDRVLGAVAGFALGEATAGGDGTLIAGLLHGLDTLRATVAGPLRPDGWLDSLIPHAEPLGEARGIAGAVAATADPQWWSDGVTQVFRALFAKRLPAPALHQVLAEQGRYGHLLVLRGHRETPVAEQLGWQGLCWHGALLVVLRLGHDPAAALAAAGDPITAALAGALLGARHGLPGLPGEPPHRDLLEQVTLDAYTAFGPVNSDSVAHRVNPGSASAM